MAEAFLLVVAVGVAAFVGYPLLEGRKRRDWIGNHRASDLEERKEAIYAQIKDIDFDYATGKLSEEDYRELRMRYKREAAMILQQLDHIASGRRIRKTSSATKPQFCATCGHPMNPGEKFCSSCGSRLP
jgi:NADH pyrophosphatase NudC (nudix superfamily)